MNSLARRILGHEDLAAEWATTRGMRALDDALWPSEEEAYAYIASREAAPGRWRWPPTGTVHRHRQLPAASTSSRDAWRTREAWKLAFEQAGFSVELLTNKQATRERMVEMIKDLVVSSRAGDVLALQYSGHGTTVEDFDHDEKAEFEGDPARVDEAICPVDFTGGNLLIDDDLGEIWDLLPDGVSLTMFFDSCHSGGNQRKLSLEIPTDTKSRARLVRLSPRAEAAYRKKRGTKRARASTGDRERGVFFGACQPNEVAWESDGQGDFTRIALPILQQAGKGSTNQEFFESVLKAFGKDRRQTPVVVPPYLTSEPLLGGSEPQRAVVIPELIASTGTKRDQAVASILRSVADLIES